MAIHKVYIDCPHCGGNGEFVDDSFGSMPCIACEKTPGKRLVRDQDMRWMIIVLNSYSKALNGAAFDAQVHGDEAKRGEFTRRAQNMQEAADLIRSEIL
jgi:hypothetical protein